MSVHVVMDEERAQTGAGTYIATRIQREGDFTVRLTVRRDFYERQSHAVAEVLTPALTWTMLITHAPALWWASTPEDMSADTLDYLLHGLEVRAYNVLFGREGLPPDPQD